MSAGVSHRLGMTNDVTDLGDIARERAWLRRGMTDQARAEIAAYQLTCRCLTPWVSHADRVRLGLIGLAVSVCSVRWCPLCAGSGVASQAGVSDLRYQNAMSGRRTISFPEHRPMRRGDPRFPVPTHTTQPGVTWDDARAELAKVEAWEREAGEVNCAVEREQEWRKARAPSMDW